MFRFSRRRTAAIVAVVAGAVGLAAQPSAAQTQEVPRAATARVQVASTAQDEARLAPARRVLASPRAVTVAVLDDSVGNDPGEWVSMWAGDMAVHRYVFVHHFDWQTERYSDDVEVFPPSAEVTAEPVVVWNFGWPGGTPKRALQHLAAGVPKKPDLTIVSFGHNLGPAAVQPQYAALQEGLTKRFGRIPVVTTVAHMAPIAQPAQAEGRVMLVQWLRSRGMPFIDMRAVFDDEPDPSRLFWDAIHPNVLGYRRLSDVVSARLSSVSIPISRCTEANPSRAAVRWGPTQLVARGRTSRLTTRLRATDGCGRPLAHAWVSLSAAPQGRTKTTTISAQTDRSGRVTIETSLPGRFSGAVTGVVTDGTTTVHAPVFRVTAAG